MKTLLTVGISVGLLIFLLVVAGCFLPRHYLVQRSLHIQATDETVYAYIADLRRWREWGVWYARDPQMAIVYSEKTDAMGGWVAWTSKGQKGKMTLTTLQPPSRAGYRLEFPGMGLASAGLVEIVPDGAGVNVTLSDEGDLGNNPLRRWVGPFLDRMIGPDFEAGLVKLKQVSEKGS